MGGPMPDGPDGAARRGSGSCGSRYPKGLMWGIIIIGVGLVFLLDQMGVASADEVFRFFWPAVFLFFGIEGIVTGNGAGKFWGTMLTLTGILFLFNALHLMHVTFAVVWPMLIIFWGVSVLLQTMGLKPAWHYRVRRPDVFGQSNVATSDSELDYTLIFSGVKRKVLAKDLRGGKIVAVFGGFNLDLRKADMAGDEVRLHIDAVFGGGEIRVPDTWRVNVRSAAVLGAFVDETQPPYDLGPQAKRLVLTGSAVFGGVNIKN